MAFEWDESDSFTLGFLSSLVEGDLADSEVERALGLSHEAKPGLMDSLRLLGERESSSLQNLQSLCEDISLAPPPPLPHLPRAMVSTQQSGESKKTAGTKRKKVRFSKEERKKTDKKRKEGVEKTSSESENEPLASLSSAGPALDTTSIITSTTTAVVASNDTIAAPAVAAEVNAPSVSLGAPIVAVLEEGTSPSNVVPATSDVAPAATATAADFNIIPDGVLETEMDDYVLESMQDTSKLGDGLWVSGTKPVSYITDQQKKCYNYGQSLVYLAVNSLDAMLARNSI